MTLDQFEALTPDQQEELLEKHFGPEVPEDEEFTQSPEWRAELKEWQYYNDGVGRVTLH